MNPVPWLQMTNMISYQGLVRTFLSRDELIDNVCGMILLLMCTMDDMRLSAILLPVWIVFLFVAFKTLRRKVN